MLPLYGKISARALTKQVPLFPGYVFSAFDLKDRLPILTVPGVYHIVSLGHIPEPMDGDELLALERFAASGVAMEPWAFLQTGELVVVERGPLAGLKGILVEIKDSQRLVISLRVLQQSVAVEVDRDDLRLEQLRVPVGKAEAAMPARGRLHSILSCE
jgi:transcription antitermination factor NusG